MCIGVKIGVLNVQRCKTHNKSHFLNRKFSYVKNLSLNQQKRLLELALSKSLRNSYIKVPLNIAIKIGYEEDICKNFESISNTFIRNKKITNISIGMLIQEEDTKTLIKKFIHVDNSFSKLKPLNNI